jgi:GntR family transcriptional regulator
MTFRIRADSTTPIYEQIASQLTFAVAAGDLPPGELVPSVRDLAAELVVNPNTVQRAYTELERDGILESRRGLGMAVTTDAPKLCRNQRRTRIVARIRETLREASAAGLTLDDVTKLVADEWPRRNHTP